MTTFGQKHSRWIRWTHWINFPLLSLMIWSGLLIYWSNDIYWPFFPQWFYELFGLEQRLAEGMSVHFLLAWLFTINGITYVAYLLGSGEWRELSPNRHTFRDAYRVVLHDLGLRKEPLPAGKFNGAQRIAYTSVIFMSAGAILSGLAIYKPVQLRLLTRVMGGYEGARLLHFGLTLAFVGFFGVHIAQVVRAGWKNARAMITGYEVDPTPHLLRRSVIVGVAASLLGSAVWLSMRAANEYETEQNGTLAGTPAPFRTALELNGRLWAKLYSASRLTERPRAPAAGTRARINGDIGLEAPIDLAAWRLSLVSSPGAKPDTLTMAFIRTLPRTETTTVFKCIEGWSEEIAYAGVKFSDFMHALGIQPGAEPFVSLETPDGEYYVSIDAASMMHPQTLLAYEMNGAPLSSAQGAPLRLIIPVKYGIKSLKRIGTIRFTRERGPDYWAERGYDWFAGL